MKSLKQHINENLNVNEGAYTLKKAIKDYTSEIEELKQMKKDGEKTVDTETYDLDDTVKGSTMSIDAAIKIWERKLAELKEGNVDPEDYNY